MYLYNITYIVEEASATHWFSWMKSAYIPEILATEKFVSNRLLQVVDSPNEGVTYCSQFIAESLEDVKSYQLAFEANHQQLLQTKFANKFVSFNSIMKFIA
jgi:hypothetical protein